MSDDELFQKYKADRDPRTYERLVEAHRPLVASVCRRLLRDPNDVEDVVQETFLKLAGRVDTVTSSITGWLATTAQLSSVDLIRREVSERNRRHGLAQAGRVNHRPRRGQAEDMSDLAAQEAIRFRLHDALLGIDPDARELLTERFVHRTPLRVLAGQRNISVPTASRRVAGAVRELAEALREMGVAGAEDRAVADHFGDAAALVDPRDAPDAGGLRFAADWHSAVLAPMGVVPAQAFLPGWSRPMRVGALVSYNSTFIVGANRKTMNIWQQVYSTTAFPQAGLQLVGVVEPGTTHRGIVERTLRDHGLIGGLIEADDADALQTLDVLLVGINWSMTVSIAQAITRAVRSGMGLLNEYWTGDGRGMCEDADIRALSLSDSATYSYHMPGKCGSPLPATVLHEHPLLPGLRAGTKMTISGCGPIYRAMQGAQVLITKDYWVQPHEHRISGMGPAQMPCYIVGHLGRGRVVVNNTWSPTGPSREASEIVEYLSVSRNEYFVNLLRWLAGPRYERG